MFLVYNDVKLPQVMGQVIGTSVEINEVPSSTSHASNMSMGALCARGMRRGFVLPLVSNRDTQGV